MTLEERGKITSEDYVDLLQKYIGNPVALQQYEEYSVHIMNDTYAVIYLPKTKVTMKLVTQFNYSSIPHCYSLCSNQSLEASGITKLSRTTLNLRGEGVIVGIVDTGIDYTNPVFRHSDGSTKIIAIWDQGEEKDGQYPETTNPSLYGTEYKAEQINLALQSENPLQIVPSMDTIGHGTWLAGIAAGSENEENQFSGVVPDADLLVVKLKGAKAFYRSAFGIPEQTPAFQENDIIWGIQYLVDTARHLGRPLAICIGLGTSMGSHDNSDVLNSVASIVADFPGVAITIAAGNEGNSRRHFHGMYDPKGDPSVVELNVGVGEAGFMMEFWGNPPTIYTLDITSPAGEYIPRILENMAKSQEIAFIFERTRININFFMVEAGTGKQVITFRFLNPSEGIWMFRVYGRGDLKGDFHIWLPSDDFISKNTFFNNSDQENTVTSPGNSNVPITITAYNSINDTIYAPSGRGYTVSGVIAPALAAPGVNIKCPALNQEFTMISGTGAAAAHAAGITAMVLEWSFVKGNFPGLDTVGIKKFLIRGARRSTNLDYPNHDWGYGMIDIYNSFSILRTDINI